MKSQKEKLTLDYFKGVFHTYEAINNPKSDVYFVFDIFDFEFKNSIKESFIENFMEFKGAEFHLNKIHKNDFFKVLNKWFYTEFNPNSINNKPSSEIIKDLVNDIVYSLDISNFYRISSVKKNNKSKRYR